MRTSFFEKFSLTHVVYLLVVIIFIYFYLNKTSEGLANPVTDTNADQVNKELSSLNARTSFCKSSSGELQKSCAALTESNCLSVSCCVLGHDKTSNLNVCLAGDATGPTFKNDQNIDYFYYMDKSKKMQL
jgi:hypothetical protein